VSAARLVEALLTKTVAARTGLPFSSITRPNNRPCDAAGREEIKGNINEAMSATINRLCFIMAMCNLSANVDFVTKNTASPTQARRNKCQICVKKSSTFLFVPISKGSCLVSMGKLRKGVFFNSQHCS
jgi:hypothetical protein